MLANIPVVRVNSLSTTDALYIKVSLIRWTAPVYFWLMPLSFRHIKVAVIFVFNINPHSFFIYNEKRASQEPADGSLSRRCAPSADSHGTFQLNVWVKRTHHLSKSAHLFILAYLYFSVSLHFHVLCLHIQYVLHYCLSNVQYSVSALETSYINILTYCRYGLGL